MNIAVRYQPIFADPLEQIPTLPEEPATKREILLRAAEIMRKRGIAVGTLENSRGQVCLLGAVALAEQERELYPSNIHFTRTFAFDEVEKYQWNDELPFGGWRKRRTKHSTERAATALERLADGATWEEAIT